MDLTEAMGKLAPEDSRALQTILLLIIYHAIAEKQMSLVRVYGPHANTEEGSRSRQSVSP